MSGVTVFPDEHVRGDEGAAALGAGAEAGQHPCASIWLGSQSLPQSLAPAGAAVVINKRAVAKATLVVAGG